MTDSNTAASDRTALTSRQRKQFRQIAHHLQPIVTVAEKGLSDALLRETLRALTDHELIKVKLNILDREQRQTLGQELAQQSGALIVQTLGKTLVLYRENPKVDARLSNVVRYQISGS